jgi:hypothetical protein
MFSGGAASAYAAILVAERENKGDVILLNSDTGAEHPDTRRFMRDISDYLGIEVTHADAGYDLWDCIERNHALPSYFMPFCTRELKLESANRYLAGLGEYVQYNGFGVDEWRRVQRSWARGVVSPLFDLGLTGAEAKSKLVEMGFRLPEAYEYLEHNNCIPCFKAGKGHFKRVWEHFPCQFAKAVEAESAVGHTVFKGVLLTELAERWEKEKEGSLLLFLEEDEGHIPCACWD